VTTTETTVRHRPAVRAIGATEHAGPRWQARCTCGESGPEHRVRGFALADRDAHIAALGLPSAEQRCRRPREHRVQPWEACWICPATVPLPLDLPEEEAG
jgi:hypothetical protein